MAVGLGFERLQFRRRAALVGNLGLVQGRPLPESDAHSPQNTQQIGAPAAIRECSCRSIPGGSIVASEPELIRRRRLSLQLPDRGLDGETAWRHDGLPTVEGMPLGSLPSVNLYAESLDVLMPNFINQESLRRGVYVKYCTPIAGQPPGSGRTALGLNLTAVLQCPREKDAGVEAMVADRIRSAWLWNGPAASSVEAALLDPRPEILVVRTLIAKFPHQEATILKLKAVDPLVVEMKTLVGPDAGFGWDKALAYAIFCASRRLNGALPASRLAFTSQDPTLQMAVGAVTELTANGEQPVLLVLDGISDLGLPAFRRYFDQADRSSALHRAMYQLSATLQLLHAIPHCFVFCTGRSLVESSEALMRSGSHVILTSVTPTSA